ncbi:hypothetical protein [Allomuricauda sp. d1]|uniref:hypothetical protein n=1 Tax=Allomuricauda sp. d1 TaxID=3136725 RepID=UPI0031E487BD
MKTSLYVMMVFFSAIPFVASDIKKTPYSSERQEIVEVGLSGKKKTKLDEVLEFQGLRKTLSADYRQLAVFSKSINSFGINEKSFEQLFWEGALESLKFYRSSEGFNQLYVNQLIETELWLNPNLGHPLKRPDKYKTSISNAFGALNQFSGEWHGKWQTMKVHHLWLPVRESNEKIEEGFALVGFQSCFTGDGFGWNYVVKENNNILVLGFVYHFDGEGSISAKNPHYAFVNPKNQLTWVSDDHIYYEFVCADYNCPHKKHYVITGAKYAKQPHKLKLVSGFQAIYLAEDFELPDFKHLYINGLNRTKSFLANKLFMRLKVFCLDKTAFASKKTRR